MKNKIQKLKKYLFLISTMFFLTSFSHILYTYLFNDSTQIPIEWWVISEWLIWDFPSLNPFKPLVTWNNKYLINLLYRSLLKYDTTENKIVGDIVNCDIDNLSYVECYLRDNIRWSNWEDITINDIVSTYKILQNTEINPVIKALLQETEIIEEENIIAFKNEKSDINFLNIFFQPIINEKVINNLSEENLTWNFPSVDWIYSWKFKITNISGDLAIWTTKFILEKNEYYNENPILIEQLIIKLFSNTNSLLKNKDNINVFNDSDNLIWNSIPRFENTKYYLPQYVSLFLNKDKIQDTNLRNFLLEQINPENLINILWKENYKVVNNPFFTEKTLTEESKNKNFENILSKLWYYKKAKLIEEYSKETKTYTDESEITVKVENPDNLSIDIFQKDSEYIIEPEYVDKYNFVTKGDILLKWVAPENTQEVYLNDYKLSNFKANDRYFYYRLKTTYDSISVWTNSYKLYFVWEDGEKKLYEEFFFLYYPNSNSLKEAQKELVTKLETQRLKEIELKKFNENKNKTLEEDKNKLITKINDLDDKYYYNEDLEKFTLNLLFIDWDQELYETSNYVTNTLYEIWINVNTKPINLTQVQNFITEEKSYDMILTWINLWYFYYNLFPYLHSSQAQSWYNFSKIRKTSLDILLEELKWDILNNERIAEIEDNIIEILKDEQILKTLYTPKISLLIDKKIKDIKLKEQIPNKELRNEIYDKVHIKEKRILNLENKNFIGLLKYIISKIYE